MSRKGRGPIPIIPISILSIPIPDRRHLCSHSELSACQAQLRELTEMLQSLESLHRIPSAPLISSTQVSARVRGRSSQPPAPLSPPIPPPPQPSAATERPKKGRRTTRMWCTQSFAKDDTIGRVRQVQAVCVPNPGPDPLLSSLSPPGGEAARLRPQPLTLPGAQPGPAALQPAA